LQGADEADMHGRGGKRPSDGNWLTVPKVGGDIARARTVAKVS